MELEEIFVWIEAILDISSFDILKWSSVVVVVISKFVILYLHL